MLRIVGTTNEQALRTNIEKASVAAVKARQKAQAAELALQPHPTLCAQSWPV